MQSKKTVGQEPAKITDLRLLHTICQSSLRENCLQRISSYVDSFNALVCSSSYEASVPIDKIYLLIGERNQLSVDSKLTHH